MKSNHEKQSKSIIKTSTYYNIIGHGCLSFACFLMVDIISVFANGSEGGAYSITSDFIAAKDIAEYISSGFAYCIFLFFAAHLCFVTKQNALKQKHSESQSVIYEENHDTFPKKPPSNEMWRFKFLLVYFVLVILVTIYALVF